MWLGKNVRLSGFTKNDAWIMSRWYEDAGFLRLVDAPHARPRSEEEIQRWFEEWQKSERSVVFAARLVSDDSLLALVSLEDILWSHGVAWLGIGIGNRELWGKGYGHETMELALRYGFDELNLHRIQLTVFQYNDRAIALYEKLGFQREGVYREFMQREGKRYDMYLYGLLRPEWEAMRTTIGSSSWQTNDR
jgi:RimJ/RimL family protein N-acetyltransferase